MVDNLPKATLQVCGRASIWIWDLVWQSTIISGVLNLGSLVGLQDL